MKTKFIVPALAAMFLLAASCQTNDIKNEVNPDEKNGTIEFQNYVGGLTRASKQTGRDSFVKDDQMAVWGFQYTGQFDNVLFNGQLVENTGDVLWTYSPKRYWNAGSSYDFYAIFPYSAANSFENGMFKVADFTVNDDTDKQVDVMIAQRQLGVGPYNTVDFVFNHILSNVNFYIKESAAFDATGIKEFELVSFDVTGLKSKGSYEQTEWNNNSAKGAWAVDAKSKYLFPKASDITHVMGTSATDVVTDLLLMPQTIADDATIMITYKLKYEDGTASTFSRDIRLASIMGKNTKNEKALIVQWVPNYKYNYIMSLNPAVKDKPTADVEHNEGGHEPGVDIIVIPDTDGDGEDEYWVDEDGDGQPDYPLVWDDPDGDGTENLYPDHDGDGIPDYRDDDDPHTGDEDGDGIPDDAWVDTDGDGITDTPIGREKPTVGPDVPTDPTDPNYPDQPFIDYDGGAGQGYLTPEAYLIQDEDGEYWVDVDGDGVGDIHVLWMDIDGDGKLEGIADKDGDGKLTPADTYDGDGVDYKGNPNDYDVIMIDTDGDGIVETELEKTVDNPDVPTRSNAIEFSATVAAWEEEIEGDINVLE